MSESVDSISGITAVERDKYYQEGGKLLANPLPGEEIVISGMAGVFPSSSDIYELRKNLFNKVDMVQPHNRWDCDQNEIPPRCGMISGLHKYDAGYFGVHERQAHSMDPMARIFQEKALEAVFDAGLHPSQLEGSKTGVYVGVISSENDKAWYYDNLNPQTFAVSGCERSMIAHHLSYFLKLKGPSVILDTGCSSSNYAVENAYRAIRLGEIDNAIIGGTHLCLDSQQTLQFLQLGTLSADGACKTFDARANGYVRSEGIVVILLQKAKDSKRVYAQVVHAKTNCGGFKEQSISFPSKYSQMNLLSDFYEDCSVDRFSLCFLEAHGTGTKVGDPVECASIDSILTKGRKKPLLIGAIKSNIGHTESASGLCSIIKCILSMETGYIPPNINFKTPNNALIGIVEGRLKVVVDKTPLEEENALIAINNFGIGGANAHVLLRRNPKPRSISKDDLPRLVCVSGRTEAAVTVLLDQINSNGVDVDYIKLLHEVFRKNIPNHLYRGFTIVPQRKEISKTFAFYPQQNELLYLVFGEMGNWHEVGHELMVLQAFRDSILRIQENLMEKDVNVSDLLLNKSLPDGDYFPVLGPVAVQIAVIHLLKSVGIGARSSFGYSFGELVSAYYDNNLTLDETINCAYALNQTIFSGDRLLNPSTDQVHGILNGKKGCLLNNEIVTKIQANELSGSDNNFKYMDCLKTTLTKNVCNGIDNFKMNSVILKIGEVPLSKKEEVITVSLFGRRSKDNFSRFLEGLGSLYLKGHNPHIDELYPPVEFPVGRCTPMISPYIRWDHSSEWFVPQFDLDRIRQSKRGVRHYNVDLTDPQWAFIAGHVIDGGRLLFPATGYLYIVWETFAVIHGIPLEASRVSLKNCKFLRATSLPQKGNVVFTVSILKGSGKFEVVESNSMVAMGTINFLQNDEAEIWKFTTSGLTEPHGKSMTKKEVYKELRLRGYHYGREFQATEEYDLSASISYVKWQENWIVFLDNMLQSNALQRDSRSLEVPIFISQVNIAASAHIDLIRETVKDSKETAPTLPVYSEITTDKIMCGGITISGFICSIIARKKNLREPVLERYEFVPNSAELDLYKSVRVNVQIIIENTLICKFKAVEIIDEFSDSDAELLTPIIKLVLEDQPLIQPSLKILSANALDVDVEIENRKLETESNSLLVIASNIITRPKVLESAFAAIKENGFIISRESYCCDIKSDMYPNVTIVTEHKTPFETVLLLQKKSQQRKAYYLEVNALEDFSWIAKVQDALSTNCQEDLVLYSDDPTSGLLGMVNCLRKEIGSRNIRCIFLASECEEFKPNCEQLKKNMAVNVYKDGQWGTFRHLLLEESNIVESEHCFVNMMAKGDLSSLRWIEGPLKRHTVEESGTQLIHVCYSSVNFKDVMLATGKINEEATTSNRLDQGTLLGCEYSGKDKRGRRVMGYISKGRGLSNLLLADKCHLYPVPEDWTLEEAATVPVVYATAVYALIMCGLMKKGESVLIHSGTGGVGQAAIHLALHYGCEVFTTVGTEAKREFIKKMYPQVKDENISTSRDETFEQVVYKGTNGRGVDIVLNSLAEEKLVASVRCLATGGRFLEIGKFDLANNNQLNLLLFAKQASFHGIMLDKIFDDVTSCKIRKVVQKIMREGGIKPLNRKVFKQDEIEQAFRFMVTGKHIGKVLVKVQNLDEQFDRIPPKRHIVARYHCDPQKVYLIIGGLGGFGLELADWLVLRGARKLVLTSRKGINTGYQHYRIGLWNSYGVIVKISTVPLARKDGCKQLLEESLQLGRIDAIFNLAVVLEDAIFDNQTSKSFTNAFEPKSVATRHLDDVTRTICPDLREFVVFSSFVCGRGNPGQTNYGMTNSVVERICEKRKRDGYPALAIQWAAMGDVGIVAEMGDHFDIGIAGTLQQPISSCLQVLDILIRQNEATVVSSMVVGHKQEVLSVDNIEESVINILGLRDARCVSLYSTLSELGMDSMTTIEVKLTLETDFGIFLSTKDLRTISLARLKELQKEKYGASQNNDNEQELHFNIETFFNFSGQNLDSEVTDIRVVPELDEKSGLPKIVLFPGVEGFTSIFKNLTARLNGAVALQYPVDGQTTSIPKIVEVLAPVVEKLLSKDEPFIIVGYSFGVAVALHIVYVLEGRGYRGILICIDGAPLFLRTLLKGVNAKTAPLLENNLIYQLLSCCISYDEVAQNKANIFKKRQTWEERINSAVNLVKNYAPHKARYLEMTARTVYNRLKVAGGYSPLFKNLKSNVKLFKPTSLVIQDIVDDYGLSEFFEKSVEVQVFEGNHETILENKKLADSINSYLL